LSEPTKTAKAKRKFAEEPLLLSALMILLARNGGQLTFTEADYQAEARSWGGPRNFSVQASVITDGPGKPRKVQVELVRRLPGSKTVT